MNINFKSFKGRTITEANINYYASPFVHPRRKMKEHDFIYMLSGEWKIGQNNKSYSLKKDSLLILSAGETHYGITPCTENTKTMYFHISAKDGDNISLTDNSLKTFYDTSGNKNIKKIFYDIVESKLSGNEKRASVLFELLLIELETLNKHNSNAEIGEQIKNIIHKNPEKFFSNKHLADLTGVSTKTAENKFKTLYGITIHQYILNFKIEQAISYIRNFPEMPIKEIAFNLGFYDEYHFSKQFKKITGSAPTHYSKIQN